MENTSSLQVGRSYAERTLDMIRSNLGELNRFIEDPSIDEIQINTPDEIYVRSNGIDKLTGISIQESKLQAAFVAIASFSDKTVARAVTSSQEERSRKLLSAKLPGLRIEGVLPPIAVRGVSLCIRKHSPKIIPLSAYESSGVITASQAITLKKIASAGETFIVAGSTYSGKTTLLNAIIQEFPLDKRLFVIEQVSELKIATPNHVSVECDPEQGLDSERALRLAMRFSPHSIVMGELRGAEAITFLEASNTGHSGATTIHSDSARDALSRLEDLCFQANRNISDIGVRTRIARSVKWVMHIGYTPDGRKLKEIWKVRGINDDKQSYLFEDYTNHEY